MSWVLEDLLLFSPRVYWRLFALENDALWPAQPVLLAAAALLALCLLRGWRPTGLWLGPMLGAAWLWTGWHFVALRYGTVNWAAPTFAWGFYAEAGLLAGIGLSGRLVFARRGVGAWFGIALLAAAALAWPAFAPLDGRSWHEAEVVALAPDPTAVCDTRACWHSASAAAGQPCSASRRRYGLDCRRSRSSRWVRGRAGAVLAALLAGVCAWVAHGQRTSGGP